MHTGKPGFKHRTEKPELRVEYVHMGMTLAYVEDLLIGAIMRMEDVSMSKRIAVIRAFNKILWIQNDLFARHYIDEGARRGEFAREDTPKSEKTEDREEVKEGEFVNVDSPKEGGCPFAT